MTKTVEIRSLTGLRGIAAVYVMAGHYSIGKLPSGLLQRVLDHKYIAVDLFFILSGFVLTMAYGGTEPGQPLRVGYYKFMADRFARIAPLYLTATLTSYVLLKAGKLHFGVPSDPDRALIPNLLAIQSWIWSPGSLDAPGWSVSTEWAANLALPVMISAALMRSRILTALLACCSFLVLGGLAAFGGGRVEGMAAWGSLNIVPGMAPLALFRCAASFMLGVATYRLARAPGLLSVAGSNSVGGLATLAVLGLLPFPCADVVLIVLFCVIILSLYANTNFLARTLSTGPLHWLGVISFSIYLVHVPLLALDDAVAPTLRHSQHFRILLLGFEVALALVVSAASYYGLENPARHALKQIASRKPRRARLAIMWK